MPPNQSKNILLIIPYGAVGGIEKLALNFYNYYKAIGHEVKVVKIIKLENDIINFNADEFFLSNKDLYELSSTQRLLFYVRAPKKLRTLIERNGFTHSIAFGDMANLFSSLTRTKEFKIASIHALKSVEFSNKTWLNKVFKLAFKTTYGRIDKTVCISRAIKNDLIENCGFRFKDKLEIIYNPHDIERIQKMADVPIENDAERELFKGKSIVFLGRLAIQKSPWHLISAFASLRKRINGKLKLIFIGDGDPVVEQHINGQIREYAIGEDVVFLGRKSNPYQYIKHADVLALASHYEGTPNVIVESIAVGTPVVSSNCTDGIGELMSLDEKLEYHNEGQKNVEAGIITPNLFKGTLGVPGKLDTTLNKEEAILVDALEQVLTDESYKARLSQHQTQLLKKFDMSLIATRYLEA